MFRKIAWLITAVLLHVPRSGETKGARSLRHSSSDNSRLRPPWSSSSELGWDTCAGYTGRGKNGTCDTGDSITYYCETLLDAHFLKKSRSSVLFSFYRPLSLNSLKKDTRRFYLVFGRLILCFFASERTRQHLSLHEL